MATDKNKTRRVLTTATAKHSVSCPFYFVKVLKGTGNPTDWRGLTLFLDTYFDGYRSVNIFENNLGETYFRVLDKTVAEGVHEKIMRLEDGDVLMVSSAKIPLRVHANESRALYTFTTHDS